MDEKTKNFIGGNIIGDITFEKFVEESPNSLFDLVLFRPEIDKSPVKSSSYGSWLFDQSKKIMRVLKSTGSLVVIAKEGVNKGKRDPYLLEYLQKMSDYEYWTETFIWHKANPHPTGNKKRLKDGFEYCYQFNRSKDYKFFPDNCLIKAKSEWSMGESSSRWTRSSNVLSFPSKNGDLPVGLCEFFINLMTEKGDLVFVPSTGIINEVTACLNTSREYLVITDDEKEATSLEECVNLWKEENIVSSQTIFG